MICQTQALNRGTLSQLQFNCFLISQGKYFTAFAYLLFPYCRYRESDRDKDRSKGMEAVVGETCCVQSASKGKWRQCCAAFNRTKKNRHVQEEK